MHTTIYLIDDAGIYAGATDIDPMSALPRCTLTPPPALTGTEVAQWRDDVWQVLPAYPQPPVPSAEQLQAEIVGATQRRLDDFARTRNYDGILSACTYATSLVPKFTTEGQYAVQARDATWATLYALLAEVQSGTRPAPASFDDVAPLLPALEWPQ